MVFICLFSNGSVSLVCFHPGWLVGWSVGNDCDSGSLAVAGSTQPARVPPFFLPDGRGGV